MSALLLPAEPSDPSPDDRTEPRLIAVADGAETASSARPSRAGEHPGRSDGSAPTARRTRPAGEEIRPRPLSGPEPRQHWDPLRFQPDLGAQEELNEAPNRRRGRKSTATSSLPSSTAKPAAAAPPQREAAVLVCAATEVLLGLRPADQLARWTTPALFDALSRRAGLARRLLGQQRRVRPVVRSAHLQATPSGAFEATVVLHDGERVRAAAARLVSRRGRWVLEVLEIA